MHADGMATHHGSSAPGVPAAVLLPSGATTPTGSSVSIASSACAALASDGAAAGAVVSISTSIFTCNTAIARVCQVGRRE